MQCLLLLLLNIHWVKVCVSLQALFFFLLFSNEFLHPLFVVITKAGDICGKTLKATNFIVIVGSNYYLQMCPKSSKCSKSSNAEINFVA